MRSKRITRQVVGIALMLKLPEPARQVSWAFAARGSDVRTPP